MFHGLATLLSQPSPTSTVSRSTLSLNKERRPLAAPNQQHQHQQQQHQQQQHQQQQHQQLHFQERLVDWDRPAASVGAANRINSNSSPSLAAEMASSAGAPGAMHQRHMTSLRNANSKSVPALHSDGQEGSATFQEQPPAPAGAAEMMYPPQQHLQARVMANQRTMSAQHLPQQQQQQQQRMAMPQQLVYSAGIEPTSPTSRLVPPLQQQLPAPATRSRSVQNLSEVQQQVNSQQRASLRARHPSNPSVDEERQYQNISLYQQQMVAQQQQQVSYPKVASTARGLLSPVNRSAHLRAPSSIGQQSESPPPPPPPPTSTHPLLANQSNPWEREEKEREVLRRQEAARIWMEEQIAELEALGQQRSPKQEEQLRTLRLEMEFRKRAQEAAKDEEEEVPILLSSVKESMSFFGVFFFCCC